MKKTYVSLFSSAGIGCYGFKEEGFECIFTNELLEERMKIQIANEKCKYNSGYILGDIKNPTIQKKIKNEIDFWKIKEGIEDIDVLIATPPCQGMSSANYKKNQEDQIRNSLVVEAIKISLLIKPKIIIFENVRSFMKTICTYNNNDLTIEEAIYNALGSFYNLDYKILNFKNYGVPSSRTRTLLIASRKDLLNIAPPLLFPDDEKEIPLKESIGLFKSLKEMNDYDKKNPFHFFRPYPEYMRPWIANLKQGQSAFESSLKPYKIVDGEQQTLKSGHLGNKFKRLNWNQPSACITTRNDQLASQETIHPKDDRVLSVAELMSVMTIPKNFKWFFNQEKNSTNELYNLIRKNELKIRRAIGEAVPTLIFKKIAKKISDFLELETEILNVSSNLQFDDKKVTKWNETAKFIFKSFLEEKQLLSNKSTGSFYTNQAVVFKTLEEIKTKNIKDKEISIMEPSVGTGNFLPQIFLKFKEASKLTIYLNDIDENAIIFVKNNIFVSEKVHLIFLNKDYTNYNEWINLKVDYVIGNPPFSVETKKNIYLKFLENSLKISNNILFILPKPFLNSKSGFNVRKEIENHKYNLVSVVDYGIKAFKNVYVEIISIFLSKDNLNNKSFLETYFLQESDGEWKIKRELNYFFHKKAWLIYRDEEFDNFIKKLSLDEFIIYRDRQLTNKYLKNEGSIRVLKSKNIDYQGNIISKTNYDKFVDETLHFKIFNFINNSNTYIVPNFTYKMRMAKLPKNTVVNGSIAIFLKKDGLELTEKQIGFVSSKEFNSYFKIVQNKSKFTLNIDEITGYYFGVIR